MKKIAIEEHCMLDEYVAFMQGIAENKGMDNDTRVIDENDLMEIGFLANPSGGPGPGAKLLDTGEGRIKEMDDAGIDMQVLSVIPPLQIFHSSVGVPMAERVNNALAGVVKANPARFAGMASVCIQDAEASADELERAVKKLGLKAAFVTTAIVNEYLDSKRFWPFYEAAEKLEVPIYIHPKTPSPDMVKPYMDYPALMMAACGFSAEASLCALRMIYSGMFDQFPKLNVILGHMGEGLPYWMWRIDNKGRMGTKNLKKAPSDYIKNNFYMDTSGMYWMPAMMCAYLALGADRLLLGVDHPFESMEEAATFFDSIPICDNDKEKIFHKNAENLFKL